jgi:hypothetical protein
VGAGGAFVYGAPVALTSESAAVEIFHSQKIGEWSTSPASGVAWTLSELASMAFGIKVAVDDVAPVTSANVKLSQLYLEVEVVTIAANIDGVRTVGSLPLRLFRRGVRRVKVTGPALLQDVDKLETLFIEHELGPTPDGLGWGPKPWQRGPAIVLGKSTDLLSGKVTLDCIDPRPDYYCSWWSPFLTDIGHSLDGQGIALVHCGGGGLGVGRNQVAYIERPGKPPDGLLMDVAADFPKYDWRGLVVEYGGTNVCLNSSFSQGAGNAFTSWSSSTSGTGFVVETSNPIAFDVAGLRRAVLLGVGGTDASIAQIEQSFAGSTGGRLAIRSYNMFGPAILGAVIQRSSDGWFWDDVGNAWSAGMVINRFPNVAGFSRWTSRLISTAATTVTVHIGYFGEASTINFQAAICQVDFISGTPTHVGTDLVVTGTPITRIPDLVAIRNEEATRVWDPERGALTFGFTPLWSNRDLGGGEVKVLYYLKHTAAGDFEQIAYKRGESASQGQYYFSRVVSGVAYHALYPSAPSGWPTAAAAVPEAGVKNKITVRWTGPERELDLPARTHQIAINDDFASGLSGAVPSTPSIDPDATSYLGSNGVDSWADGYFSHFDLGNLPLYDEWLSRRPS